jgi:hypothetical protein
MIFWNFYSLCHSIKIILLKRAAEQKTNIFLRNRESCMFKEYA